MFTVSTITAFRKLGFKDIQHYFVLPQYYNVVFIPIKLRYFPTRVHK